MQERKQVVFKTPDLSKMQEVVINNRTKIYIAAGADIDEAKNRYLARQETKNKPMFTPKKPAIN